MLKSKKKKSRGKGEVGRVKKRGVGERGKKKKRVLDQTQSTVTGKKQTHSHCYINI